MSVNTVTSGEIKGRGRPRDQQLRRHIFDAALALAGAQGYACVNLTDIAARSGAGRQTIYRWWPTKAHLYTELLVEEIQRLTDLHDPEQSDLEAHLQQIIEFGQNTLSAIIVDLLAEIRHNPELLAQYQPAVMRRRALLEGVLRRYAANENSEFVVPVETVAEALAGAFWYRVLYPHKPLDAAFAHELAQLARNLLRPFAQ